MPFNFKQNVNQNIYALQTKNQYNLNKTDKYKYDDIVSVYPRVHTDKSPKEDQQVAYPVIINNENLYNKQVFKDELDIGTPESYEGYVQIKDTNKKLFYIQPKNLIKVDCKNGTFFGEKCIPSASNNGGKSKKLRKSLRKSRKTRRKSNKKRSTKRSRK